MVKLLIGFVAVSLICSLDLYVVRLIDLLVRRRRVAFWLTIVHWSVVVMSLGCVLLFATIWNDFSNRVYRSFAFTAVFGIYFSKVIAAIFLLINDVRHWLSYKRKRNKSAGETISRSEFLLKTGAVIAALPLAGLGFGIASGAHDYRVRRQRLLLANLPKAFQGMRIAQISDIHSGSFFNYRAVKGGIEMLLAEKPDLIFFTGDLVNERTDEVNAFFSIFRQIKAPLGVFSVLGNHDYGTYYRAWQNEQQRTRNFADMLEVHRRLGWILLRNENRILTLQGDEIAILGVENWGKGRFPKWGDIIRARYGAQHCAVKLLLSHDPSHWDHQVRPLAPDVDVMFAGHTHGMQFGVEIPGFVKFSPVQFVYEQWAGLYQSGNQQLYVNRGFGYIGYPGRLGIPPEIAVFELDRA